MTFGHRTRGSGKGAPVWAAVVLAFAIVTVLRLFDTASVKDCWRRGHSTFYCTTIDHGK